MQNICSSFADSDRQKVVNIILQNANLFEYSIDKLCNAESSNPKMKAFLGIKFHSDNSNRDTIESISQVLKSCDIETICIRRDVEKWGEVHLSHHQLMVKAFEVIGLCDFAVIELTEKGVGLGIEAGYAYAQGIPIITIAQKGCDISTTLAGISESTYLYNDFVDLSRYFSGLSLKE